MQIINLSGKKLSKAIFIISIVLTALLTLILLLFSKEIQLLVREIKQLPKLKLALYIAAGVVIYLLSIIVHELIHGFYFAKFSKSGWKCVKFGIAKNLSYGYATCPEPITVKQYRIVGMMPTFILGFIPLLLYFAWGNTLLLLYSLFMILSGIGDFLVFWLIRKLPGDTLVVDQPKGFGYILLEDNYDEEELKKLLEEETPQEEIKFSFKYFIVTFLAGLITALAYKFLFK